MSGVIRWEDPPPVPVRRHGQVTIPWALIAHHLRERPGQWVVVYEGTRDATQVTRIKAGTSPWFKPAGAFDACHRQLPSGVVAVYARFIGEPS